MPSLAFLMPWFMPLICEVIEVEMARPAALSAAELICEPVDRRSIDWLSMFEAEVEALAACRALMLVLMTDMVYSRS